MCNPNYNYEYRTLLKSVDIITFISQSAFYLVCVGLLSAVNKSVCRLHVNLKMEYLAANGGYCHVYKNCCEQEIKISQQTHDVAGF